MYLGSIHVPDQAFWVLCYGFYLFDNIRASDAGTLFLAGAGRGRWRIVFPFHQFEARNRAYALLNLVTPWTPAYRLAWSGRREADDTARTLRVLAMTTAGLLPLRVLANLCFCLYFLWAPVLTALYGLSATLVLLLGAHLAGTVAVAIALASARRLRAGRLQKARLVFECLVCPGVQANVFRRVCLDFVPIRGDALSLAVVTCPPSRVQALERELSGYLDYLAERDALSEEASRHAARCLEALRIWLPADTPGGEDGFTSPRSPGPRESARGARRT